MFINYYRRIKNDDKYCMNHENYHKGDDRGPRKGRGRPKKIIQSDSDFDSSLERELNDKRDAEKMEISDSESISSSSGILF